MGGDLALAHAGIMIERHGNKTIVAAHQAGEAGDSANGALPVIERRKLCAGIEILVLDADLAHPPVTGGKKATSSFGPMRASKPACS